MTGPGFLNCTDCKTPILDERTAARRVTAWETRSQSPSRRNGRDVVLLERKDEWLCFGCLENRRRGVASGQQTLDGEAA
jgi:hypothetical protein